jgi:hypothetical protein
VAILLVFSKPEVWNAIFTGISTLVLIVGLPIALVNLRIIAKQQRLLSIRDFLEDWLSVSEDRQFVIQEFVFSRKVQIEPDIERRAKKVIDCLNRVNLLLDNRLLPSKLVFGVCHTQIIRCGYKLEDYIKYHEERIGGRYGRQVIKLIQRAKRFHDANFKHRITQIKIDSSSKKSIVVYKTKIERGWRGIKQKVGWMVRRVTGLY